MQNFDYAVAESVSEAIALLAEKGDQARVLSGGTDLIVQLREGKRHLECVIDLKKIPELNQLTFDENGLTIGASVPCYKIYSDPLIRSNYPGLIDACSIIGGIQIQSRASVGGNLCNASPAADSIPALISLSAKCKIAGPSGNREVAVEDFCTGPGRTVLENGELLISITLPKRSENSSSFYHRFIPRNEMDIAVVGVGASVDLSDDHQSIISARIALGAVGPTPIFAREASDLLVGQNISDEVIDRAANAAKAVATPISDMRGTAAQRTHLVGVLTDRALRSAIQRVKEDQ